MTSTFDPRVTPPPLCVTGGSNFFAVRVGPGADSYSARSAFESRHRYLDNVLPPLALDDDADICLGDPKPSRHRALISPLLAVGANEPDVVVGKFGIGVSNSQVYEPVKVSPTLRVSVGEVFCVRSDEEMIGIDAVRRVAVMTHEQAVGNGSPCQFVGEAMDVDLTSVNSELSVPRPRPASVPQKASRVRFGDALLGKTLCNRSMVAPGFHASHSTTDGGV